MQHEGLRDTPPHEHLRDQTRVIIPNVFDKASKSWTPITGTMLIRVPLYYGQILRLVSWNIAMDKPGKKERGYAAMEYLSSAFGDPACRTVVFLQEMTEKTSEA